MSYLGSWKIDDVLYFYADTQKFDTGVGTDGDGVATYRVYENETTVPILTGNMALLDAVNTAGFYSEAITLSAANGFEKGKQYAIHKTVTVNSVTASSTDTLQIEAEVDANTVTPAVVTDTASRNASKADVSGLSTLTQAQVTGGAYALDTDANGRIRNVVGTGTGELTISSGVVSANAVQISGDSTAADNLESQYDETGLSGNTFPSTQLQLSQVGSGGGSAENEFVIAAPNGFVITTGTGEVNDEDSTVALDNVVHQINDDGGTIDVYYLFEIGAAFSPNNLVHDGRVTGLNDSLDVYVNTNTQASPTWVLRATIPGTGGSTNIRRTIPLASGDQMVGADVDKVAVRFTGTGLTTATLSTDQILVEKRSISSSTGYELGAVWYDDNNGEAGVVEDFNGIARRPSNNVADMMTIAGLTKLRRFEIGGGSTWVFDRAMDNYTISGNSYTVDFNSEDGNGLTVTGATVDGILTGAGAGLVDCRLADGVTLPPGGRKGCVHPGNVNLTGAFHLFDKSKSALSGFTNFPSVTLTEAVALQAVSWREISGGMEVISMKDGDTMTFEGRGQIVIDASCTGGEIAVRGHFTKSGDATAIAAITWSEGSRYDSLLVAEAVFTTDMSAYDGVAGVHTLYTIVMAPLEFSAAGGFVEIYETDGDTVHATVTAGDDENANPIISGTTA